MATEYGLFSDEGLVESGFYSAEEAREAARERYSEEDGLEIEEVCPDHPEQPHYGCEDCDSEEMADQEEADLDEKEEEEDSWDYPVKG
jgi:hypothetical protein